jgi:hypothetical protein
MVVIAGDIFELWRAARREEFEMLFKEKYKGRRRGSSKIWSFAIRAKGPVVAALLSHIRVVELHTVFFIWYILDRPNP